MFAPLVVYDSGLLRRKNQLLAMTESSVVSSLQSLSARLPHQIKTTSPNLNVFPEKWNYLSTGSENGISKCLQKTGASCFFIVISQNI
jgi:hypothetical protein